MSGVLRGQIVRAYLPNPPDDPEAVDEPKLFVVVSNNRRNSRLPDFLAARLTTSAKPPLPSIIELPDGEPVHGRVLCDDTTLIDNEDVIKVLGVLSPRTMAQINTGLADALGL